MKIMIFNTLYAPYKVGGAEVSVQLLAEELAEQGHNVRVVTLNRDNHRKEVVLNGVTVVYLPLKNVFWPYANQTFSKLKKILWHALDVYNPLMYTDSLREINSFNPDVVHTNNLSGFSVAVWKAVKKNNIRLVHTSRDYYLFHPNSTMFKNGSIMDPKSTSVSIWSYIKKKMSNYVDEYVGISSFIKNLHKKNCFFGNAKDSVIFNSVNKIANRKVYNDNVTVGFLGRLSIEKGYDEFCHLALRYKDNKKLDFIAAGVMVNNSDKPELERLSSEANVQVKGFMPLGDFLDLVDVVVLPIKWNEPFGRTIVECSLSNKIVITTNVGAMPELSDILGNVKITNDLLGDFATIINDTNPDCITPDIVMRFKSDVIARSYLDVYES